MSGTIRSSTFVFTGSDKLAYSQHPEQLLVASIPSSPLTLSRVNTIYAAKTGYVSTTQFQYNTDGDSVFVITFNNQTNCQAAQTTEGGPLSFRVIGGTTTRFIQQQLVIPI